MTFIAERTPGPMENTVSLASGTPSGPSGSCRHHVEYSSSTVGASTDLVGVVGQLDAANALSLSAFVEPHLESTSRLIVDLRALSFFGIQGFSILHRINVMCSRRSVNWVIIPGVEVDRVLHICDPDGALPVAASLEEAIVAVVKPPRSHLRLVSGD